MMKFVKGLFIGIVALVVVTVVMDVIILAIALN